MIKLAVHCGQNDKETKVKKHKFPKNLYLNKTSTITNEKSSNFQNSNELQIFMPCTSSPPHPKLFLKFPVPGKSMDIPNSGHPE